MDYQYKKESALKGMSDEEREEVSSYSERYKEYLSTAKTERLAHDKIVKILEDRGFKNGDDMTSFEKNDKFYFSNRGKALAIFVMGEEDIEDGMNIVGAHMDSPRLDIKAVPLYEDGNMVLLKTHYYGGIKKYQWASIPLALYGVVYTRDGKKVDIAVGDREGDPVFFINDLLVHLSSDQMKKRGSEIIEGESLNIVVGSDPKDSEEESPIKAEILKYLKLQYGIEERDFQTAEISAVPQGKASDLGFDRSMIVGYGQDDSICSYAALEAILETDRPKKTACALLVDKEEIGSVGNSGMESRFFEVCLEKILYSKDKPYYALNMTLRNSDVLSADVTACYDPNYPEAFDKENSASLGSGVVLTKYTGSRGKSGSNDADAEYLSYIRNIFDQCEVSWQTGELGKVDKGGGGTIAYILANYGARTVDCGTGILSMHAPWESSSKVDAYMTKKAYKSFYNFKG